MGLLLYPEFQKEVPVLKENSTGEFLIRVVELLDEIAEELSFTPLGSFDRYSGYTDYAEELALSGGNPNDVEPPDIERWFVASEGVETVEGLRTYLIEHKERAATIARRAFADEEAIEGVLYESEDLAQQLQAAAEHQIKFHLTVPW